MRVERLSGPASCPDDILSRLVMSVSHLASWSSRRHGISVGEVFAFVSKNKSVQGYPTFENDSESIIILGRDGRTAPAFSLHS